MRIGLNPTESLTCLSFSPDSEYGCAKFVAKLGIFWERKAPRRLGVRGGVRNNVGEPLFDYDAKA